VVLVFKVTFCSRRKNFVLGGTLLDEAAFVKVWQLNVVCELFVFKILYSYLS
jgi:hypothetical protein